jgi:hypothetical protein
MHLLSIRLLLFFCVYCLVACSSTKYSKQLQPGANITAIKFLGEYDVPYDLAYDNTTVGGLSGIDYDNLNHCYYMISDDRSAINPARFYSANISFTEKGIDTICFSGVKNLLQKNGTVYPNYKQDPFNTPDPEAIRYNPIMKQFSWSSEGERILKEKDTVLSDPAIRVIDLNGKFIDSFLIPVNLQMKAIEKGPRQNGVFEGITFADNYKTVFVSVEEPLYEDGPRADINDNNSYIRLLKFDLNSKKNISQYAYKLEPVAYKPEPANAFRINGVPDILSIAKNKLLVIERSFSTGRLACTIKIFLTDLSNATDIKKNPSLQENKKFVAATKKLILNMDDLGIYIDNIEGVTFGPILPNGHKTLLFIADNNFNPLEKSQVLLFEVIE